MTVRVQREDFDVGAEMASISGKGNKTGGICCFVGVVRDFTEHSKISSMTLEHYPGMTEKQLKLIEEEAHQRWSLEASLIIHRYGELSPGESIVLVITASCHRKEAFESCEFLIDWLKTKAPFWKKEHTPNGAQWVQAKFNDELATQEWEK